MPRVSGTKRSILDAALELASLNGITGTTMEDVAVRAGVAKGSVYYNFSSKDKLFEQLLLDGVGSLAETLRSARGNKTGAAALGAMVHAMLEAISGNQPLAKLIAAEIFRTDRSWQTPLQLVRREALAELVQVIRQAHPERQDAELVAGTIFGAVLVGGIEWLVFSPDRSLAEVADSVMFTLSGQLTG
ncbi:TetR/AcrR family transcriptional regulator [Arthrobacter citreus]|uniref:TetR/AcrR family transcriptional regulator n=1 Tax=Arthrobacter TaxID=1663 RepID=UPI0012649451|nr:TetR/AcrR family transcriptional regulator [Arthrobacter gandavensis]